VSQLKQGTEGEERHSALLNNAGAIRAICSAVEGTLGPKGLDAMLVEPGGRVIVTNDGVTILEKMDVTHPAARLLIQVARAQQHRIGDGTTTATVLAGALVAEGVAQAIRGVPVAKIVSGIQLGVRLAVQSLHERSRPLAGLEDPLLRQAAYIAGREHEDIAELIIDGASRLNAEQLLDPAFHFADTILSHDKPIHEVWPGLLLGGRQAKPFMHERCSGRRVLVLQAALEPEALDEEALATEAGFQQYLLHKQQFLDQLHKLRKMDVGLIVTDRGISPEAEQFCADHGILVQQRVSRQDLRRVCELTGAVPLKRVALHKPEEELIRYCGWAETLYYDAKLERIRLAQGAGAPTVTILVGASTAEVVGERARIARDAAASVQAALRGGVLPGGGAVEISVAHDLERHREKITGMESFGVAAVAEALRKPMSQIVLNAGYNPLELVEQVRAAQLRGQTDAIGIDCDTGTLIDCMERGIVDPTLVKVHALQAAGEVAAAILRIHTVIKMRETDS
jgi:chaperonin GroEL (HSP60 family)